MQDRGFLLLESFVAMLIMGAGVTALLSALKESTSRSIKFVERMEGVRKAHDVLTVGIASFDWTEPHRSGNDGSLRWELDMVPDVQTLEDLSRGSPVLIKATVTLRHRLEGEVRLTTMFVARPPPP